MNKSNIVNTRRICKTIYVYSDLLQKKLNQLDGDIIYTYSKLHPRLIQLRLGFMSKQSGVRSC